ncbi:MAG: DUF5803 family protein, partial [Halobacteriaceae archaeon]
KLSLVLAGLILIILTTGCLGLGSVSQGTSNQNETYNWQTSSDVKFNISGGEAHGIYTLEGSRSIKIYRHTEFQGNQPIRVHAVKFKYPNGTILEESQLTIQQKNSKTVITAPISEGKIAFTTTTRPKEFSIAISKQGSYHVILPKDMRIQEFILGSIQPSGYSKKIINDRVHLRWQSLRSGEIALEYYLQRDLYIFGGIVVFGIIAAIGGTIYFWYRIKQLKQNRKQSGIDIET